MRTAGATTVERHVIDWVMNILLAILITLALLCLVQMGINFLLRKLFHDLGDTDCLTESPESLQRAS